MNFDGYFLNGQFLIVVIVCFYLEKYFTFIQERSFFVHFLNMYKPQSKHIYKSGKQRYYSKEDWITIFRAIENNSCILSMSRKTGIRRQIISQKYKMWKKMGDNYFECSLWSNKIFTKEEELDLIQQIWNLPKSSIRGQLFSDATIAETALKFYNEVKRNRKMKPFKASQGWIMDFRKRYGIKIKDSKCYYYAWEVLSFQV